MPSQSNATMPLGSSSVGFFPKGPSAPHAFSTMHTSPRDQYSMYASLGTSYQSGKQKQKGVGSSSKVARKK
ncbi:hypothetical protein BJV78DRAFT_1226946 [Lactifluus subvellereus]|nr:hypothetical protein BJV78DRAFT_1226946 [Lactifluus subvellereus]